MKPKIPNIKPQRSRGRIPSGYMIGRLDSGIGPEQLIPIGKLGNALSAAGGTQSNNTRNKYPALGFYLEGLFAADQVFPLARSDEAVKFPTTSGTEHDIATCEFASSGTARIYITDNYPALLSSSYTSHNLATITFSAGNNTGVVVWNTNPTLVPAQSLLYAVVRDADAQLAEVEVQLIADKQ